MIFAASDIATIVVAFAGGGSIAALFTYLGIRFKSSGKISTTDADILWKVLQDDAILLRGDIKTLREEAAEIKDAALKCSEANIKLRMENTRLKRQVEILQKSIRGA